MYSFEGEFKRKPIQSLRGRSGGVSSQSWRDSRTSIIGKMIYTNIKNIRRVTVLCRTLWIVLAKRRVIGRFRHGKYSQLYRVLDEWFLSLQVIQIH